MLVEIDTNSTVQKSSACHISIDFSKVSFIARSENRLEMIIDGHQRIIDCGSYLDAIAIYELITTANKDKPTTDVDTSLKL